MYLTFCIHNSFICPVICVVTLYMVLARFENRNDQFLT